MSTKKKVQKQEQESAEKAEAFRNVNPFDYGYKNDVGVTIPAPIFMALLEFTGYIAESEQKEYIEKVAFEVGTQPTEADHKEIVRVITSSKGKRSEQIFNELMTTHYENIDKGFAIHKDEEVTNIDLGDDTKS